MEASKKNGENSSSAKQPPEETPANGRNAWQTASRLTTKKAVEDSE